MAKENAKQRYTKAYSYVRYGMGNRWGGDYDRNLSIMYWRFGVSVTENAIKSANDAGGNDSTLGWRKYRTTYNLPF